MSEEKGKLVTCNRCGTTHFRKYISTERLDGGYSTSEKYEELPEGWLFEIQIGHLCPVCAGDFRSFITSFMNGNVGASWKDPKFIKKKKTL